eukprot:TRINITY_DN20220_c0_g1_i3.p1 TRINITY_DN20220_c0_g1~~TRINITY_DN20220_c0_g1_i3.p1  ORF type:complete len:555 (+),score=124.29 TRINITY_DN20220_c0_g1_i3:1399-3063(+)
MKSGMPGAFARKVAKCRPLNSWLACSKAMLIDCVSKNANRLIISQVRQRLFQEKQRCSQLEAEVRSQEERQAGLHGKLQAERSRYTALERELLTLQHAFGTTTILKPQSRGNPFASPQMHGGGGGKHGNVPYESELSRERAAVAVERQPPPVQNTQERPRGLTEAAAERKPSWDSGDDARAGATMSMTHADDELARSSLQAPEDAQRRPTSLRMMGQEKPDADAALSSQRRSWQLPRSDPDTWKRTARVNGPPPILASRTPPARAVHVDRTKAHLRNWLLRRTGIVYEDEHIALEMMAETSLARRERCGGEEGSSFGSAALEQSCRFEISMVNRCGQSVEQPRCGLMDAGHFAPFRTKLAVRQGGQTKKSALAPQERLVLEGELEVLSPYEATPQAEVSFLLADNTCSMLRLRLPLSIALFLAPCQLSSGEFQELWTSSDFVQAEVACVFPVSPIFSQPGGNFYYTKGLELGGSLCIIDGISDHPDDVTLCGRMQPASLVRCGGASSTAEPEILVRAELGSPAGDRTACRLTVRSASYLVSRGVYQVLLDVLCK